MIQLFVFRVNVSVFTQQPSGGFSHSAAQQWTQHFSHSPVRPFIQRITTWTWSLTSHRVDHLCENAKRGKKKEFERQMKRIKVDASSNVSCSLIFCPLTHKQIFTFKSPSRLLSEEYQCLCIQLCKLWPIQMIHDVLYAQSIKTQYINIWLAVKTGFIWTIIQLIQSICFIYVSKTNFITECFAVQLLTPILAASNQFSLEAMFVVFLGNSVLQLISLSSTFG